MGACGKLGIQLLSPVSSSETEGVQENRILALLLPPGDESWRLHYRSHSDRGQCLRQFLPRLINGRLLGSYVANCRFLQLSLNLSLYFHKVLRRPGWGKKIIKGSDICLLFLPKSSKFFPQSLRVKGIDLFFPLE